MLANELEEGIAYLQDPTGGRLEARPCAKVDVVLILKFVGAEHFGDLDQDFAGGLDLTVDDVVKAGLVVETGFGANFRQQGDAVVGHRHLHRKPVLGCTVSFDRIDLDPDRDAEGIGDLLRKIDGEADLAIAEDLGQEGQDRRQEAIDVIGIDKIGIGDTGIGEAKVVGVDGDFERIGRRDDQGGTEAHIDVEAEETDVAVMEHHEERQAEVRHEELDRGVGLPADLLACAEFDTRGLFGVGGDHDRRVLRNHLGEVGS